MVNNKSSVVIAHYNAENYIRKSLNFITSQTMVQKYFKVI